MTRTLGCLNCATSVEVASISVTVQVLFLDIAMPKGKSRADLVKSYDRNLGFPTEEMVKQMKESIQRINDMKTYSDWFKVNHMTFKSINFSHLCMY